MSNQQRQDEIDLVELFYKIFAFFRKYFWVMVGFLIVGASYGLFKSLKTDEFYESEMVVTSSLDNEMLISLLNNPQKLKQKGEKELLAKTLSISIEGVNDIKSIDAIFEENTNQKNSNRIVIKVAAVNRELIDSIYSGINSYIKSNTHIKQELLIEEQQIRYLIEKTEKEIEDLEELKDGEVDKNLSSQMMIINDQPMPNKLILDLTKEKLNLEKQLEFLAPYNVIQPYYIPENSTKNTKERTLMFSLIGLVLGFFVSLGHAIYLGLKSYEKKYH